MPRYRERVWPSLWMFLAGVLVVPAAILVFAPINLVLGIMLGVAIFVGYVVFLVSSSPTIEVTNDQLQVGSARIPLRYTGEITPYGTRDTARAAAGPQLDARAWLCLRGWVATSARVDITDSSDPVPYWLFSTRHPDDVRAAVEAARASRPRTS